MPGQRQHDHFRPRHRQQPAWQRLSAHPLESDNFLHRAAQPLRPRKPPRHLQKASRCDPAHDDQEGRVVRYPRRHREIRKGERRLRDNQRVQARAGKGFRPARADQAGAAQRHRHA